MYIYRIQNFQWSFFLTLKKYEQMIKQLSLKGIRPPKKLLFFLMLAFTFAVSAQTVTVSGVVADDQGPLPGVTVMVKGTSLGTATDLDGYYEISDVPADGVLRFTSIGFRPKEVRIDDRTEIDVRMEVDAESLEEVVVVGYGSMERRNVTGAIATVNVEELQKTPVPNPVEALRGRVAGMQVTRTSGQPGSGVSFKIRGTNSLGAAAGDIDANNQPLVVVDGVPLIGGNLSELNPDDIESINILKDAAASSIYGSSGANGVVLITTKSGTAGKPTIDVNFSTGFVEIANKIDMMNGDEYVRYLFDSQRAAGNLNPRIHNLVDPNELRNYVEGRDVDWQDVLLGTGMQRNLSIGASGGSDKFSFYINGDVYEEDGIVVESDYKRYSIRLNSDYKPTDWLQVGARVQFTKSFANETSNVISEFNVNGGFAPFIPISNNTPLGDVYNEDGSFTKFIRDDRFQINPLHRYEESVIDRFVTRSYVNPFINIDIVDGLTYTINTFAEDRREFFGRFQSSDYADDTPSEAQIQQGSGVTYLFDNILNYKKDFGNHSLNATFVYGMQKYQFEQSNMIAEQIPTDLLDYHAIGDALDSESRIDWNTDQWGKVYTIGRLGYGYDNRYNLTLTLRRDGSSKFAENHKYGYFPSIAGAWNIHNEAFLRDNTTLDQLKLRVSYGEMGNDNFPAFLYRANTQNVQINVGQDADGNPLLFNGYGVGNVAANPNLKWEESKQTNIGLDWGILNNRLSGSIDVFQTNTTDLLLFETIIPVNGGFTSYPSNVGETENRGIEVGINANIIQTEDFFWNVSVNWAKDQNKIVRLSRSDMNEEGEPVDNLANGWFIGQDIREIFDYKYLGVWQLDQVEEAAAFGAAPGDPRIADIDNNGVIDSEDRTFLGNPTPDWYGGINTVLNYKGIELSVLVETVQGVLRENNYYGAYSGRNNEININYWTPENPSNEFPRVGPGTALAGGLFTRAIKVQDASFVALRNVSLGYTLPNAATDNLPVSRVSLFLRGNNLKYWTDFDDAFSPESSVGSYPITSTIVFGTNITF